MKRKDRFRGGTKRSSWKGEFLISEDFYVGAGKSPRRQAVFSLVPAPRSILAYLLNVRFLGTF